MTIGTANKDGDKIAKQNYDALNADWKASFWSDPMENNKIKKELLNNC